MNSVRPSGALKAQARDHLTGHYATAISALLLIQCIVFLSTTISTGFADTTTLTGMILSLLISFILQLLAGIFTVGQTQLFFHIACRQTPKINDIFSGFKNHPDKAILIQFVLLLTGILPMTPFLILLFFYQKGQNMYLIPFLALTFVIGLILSCYLYLSFALLYYLMLDFPHYSVKELLLASNAFMKGHRAKLFYLQVSFLPLHFSALLTCGIGLLWVIPYQNTTLLFFYLDLVRTIDPNPDTGIFVNESC